MAKLLVLALYANMKFVGFLLLLFQGDPGFCGLGSFCMSSAK